MNFKAHNQNSSRICDQLVANFEPCTRGKLVLNQYISAIMIFCLIRIYAERYWVSFSSPFRFSGQRRQWPFQGITLLTADWISRTTTTITQVLSSMKFLSHATQHLADLPLSAKSGWTEYSVAKGFWFQPKEVGRKLRNVNNKFKWLNLRKKCYVSLHVHC